MAFFPFTATKKSAKLWGNHDEFQTPTPADPVQDPDDQFQTFAPADPVQDPDDEFQTSVPESAEAESYCTKAVVVISIVKKKQWRKITYIQRFIIWHQPLE